MKVILGQDVIEVKPAGSSGVSVQANGQQVELGQNKMSQWQNGRSQMVVYQQPDNVAVLEFPQTGMRLQADGNRFKLSMAQYYRGKVRGLAGTFDGEQSEDFTMPNNKVLRDAYQFAASYALTEAGECQGPAKQRQQEAFKAPSYERINVYGEVITGREAGQQQRRSKSNDAKSSRQESCTNYRVKVLERDGRTCFSTRPHVQCGEQCHPSATVHKTIDFHCVETNSASKHWVQMAKKGGNPDFSQKGTNHRENVALPESCVPNQ